MSQKLHARTVVLASVVGSLGLLEVMTAGDAPQASFVRGNANADQGIDIADAIWIINWLFRSGPEIVCQDAADVDDDGVLGLTDPVYLLDYLFRSGLTPLPPFPEIGADLSEDALSCPQSSIHPGDPLPGLTSEEAAIFFAGEAAFLREFTPEQGLGPVFIERACVACHALGGIGGGDSLDDPNHLVRRFATLNADGTYNNLANLGGDVLQTRSILEILPGCSVLPEVEPPEATIHSLRNPQAMFGAGLMDAIPDATILAGAIDMGDGVHGRANLDAAQRPGRFGWKAQGVTLVAFNAVAFNGTMGVTTPQAPNENKPQGQEISAGCADADLGATTPNDEGGAQLLVISAWAALLAPVEPEGLASEAARGAGIFTAIGCDKCHTPVMMTGSYEMPIPGGNTVHVDALSNKSAALYSDLLLHDMGPGLDEQVTMRQAKGPDFRTAPLWGLRLRRRFLHDGRAASVAEAIEAHGGESQVIRDRYAVLSGADRNAVLEFLKKI